MADSDLELAIKGLMIALWLYGVLVGYSIRVLQKWWKTVKRIREENSHED